MEPLLPEDDAGALASLALELIRKAERLRDCLHPTTRGAVAELVRSMNSYYSNLIEGHRTTPRDIEAALRRDFSTKPKERALQMQHLAHIEVQEEMERQLRKAGGGEICSAEFLCWIHGEFYQRLPQSLCRSEGADGKALPVVPGQLREAEVSVGAHLAPASGKLADFLKRFAEFYGPLVGKTPPSQVAAAAAHHRLTWIHPFLDGNGRVARLFTQAWFGQSEIDGNGLWTLSRGLARRQRDYRAALAGADEKRLNDFDGRGYLSQRRLREFCEFFLRTAIDQVEFMRELLGLDAMPNRIAAYAGRKEGTGELAPGAAVVLREIFFRGEIARGEVARLMNASARTGQKLTGDLLAKGLVKSNSPKGALRLGFPPEAAAWYFPDLYPAGTG
jgi:Fic family protein